MGKPTTTLAGAHRRNPTLVSKITGDAKTVLTSKVKTWAHESFKYKDTPQNGIKSFNINTLKNLKKDANIIITKPDKGNEAVILNKSDYFKNTRYFE